MHQLEVDGEPACLPAAALQSLRGSRESGAAHSHRAGVVAVCEVGGARPPQ